MLLAYTFGQGLAAAALVTFIFVWFLVAVRIVRRDDLGVLGKVPIVAILVIPLIRRPAYFLWDASRPRHHLTPLMEREGFEPSPNGLPPVTP